MPGATSSFLLLLVAMASNLLAMSSYSSVLLPVANSLASESKTRPRQIGKEYRALLKWREVRQEG